MDGMGKIGAYAFLAGLLLAVILGFVDLGSMGPFLLLGLGLIVGLMNINDKEIMLFLVAGIALTAGLGGLGLLTSQIPGLGFMTAIFNNIALFVAPAIGVGALKAIYMVSKD